MRSFKKKSGIMRRLRLDTATPSKALKSEGFCGNIRSSIFSNFAFFTSSSLFFFFMLTPELATTTFSTLSGNILAMWYDTNPPQLVPTKEYFSTPNVSSSFATDSAWKISDLSEDFVVELPKNIKSGTYKLKSGAKN